MWLTKHYFHHQTGIKKTCLLSGKLRNSFIGKNLHFFLHFFNKMDCFDEPPPFVKPSVIANVRIMEFYDCRIRQYVYMRNVSVQIFIIIY